MWKIAKFYGGFAPGPPLGAFKTGQKTPVSFGALKDTYDARINFHISQRIKLRPPKSIYYDSQSIVLKVMNT